MLAELLVGVKVDPHFGPVLVISAGGILVEILGDARRLLLPVSRKDIEAAVRSLKVFALLNGYRGRPKANLDSVIDAIEAVANYAIRNIGTVVEIDVNPLMILASDGSAVAVDALIIEQCGI
jgi:hypothetical protein